MEASEIAGIVKALLDKTRKKEVNWVATNDTELDSSGDDDFVVILPDATINVYKYKPSVGGQTRIVFTILNERGQEVLSVDHRSTSPELAPLILELFEVAKAKVLNRDQILDRLKVELAQPGVLGKPKP